MTEADRAAYMEYLVDYTAAAKKSTAELKAQKSYPEQPRVKARPSHHARRRRRRRRRSRRSRPHPQV